MELTSAKVAVVCTLLWWWYHYAITNPITESKDTQKEKYIRNAYGIIAISLFTGIGYKLILAVSIPMQLYALFWLSLIFDQVLAVSKSQEKMPFVMAITHVLTGILLVVVSGAVSIAVLV